MKKNKIVIASVLKPLTDSRAFGKFAISLRETNKYHINIIGFLEKKTPTLENIEFTSIFSKQRLHISRFWAPIRFANLLRKIKPELLIVSTYELLLPASILKPFFKYKLIYDLQENYSKNISLNNTLPKWLKSLAGKYVQLIERISRPSIDHFFFAEACYQQEFPEISNYTLLENKFAGEIAHRLPYTLAKKQRFKFIITGTITPVYGIKEAIHWFGFTAEKYPGSSLKIIGHVPLKEFKKELENYAQKVPELNLCISDHPIPQQEIFGAIKQADILLLPYQNLPSLFPKIPTKIYEALAMGIPMIIPENPRWEKIISRYPAGVSLDFNSPENSLKKFKDFTQKELFKNPVGEEVSWKNEGQQLCEILAQLLEK